MARESAYSSSMHGFPADPGSRAPSLLTFPHQERSCQGGGSVARLAHTWLPECTEVLGFVFVPSPASYCVRVLQKAEVPAPQDFCADVMRRNE